jgi:hypothetical protein
MRRRRARSAACPDPAGGGRSTASTAVCTFCSNTRWMYCARARYGEGNTCRAGGQAQPQQQQEAVDKGSFRRARCQAARQRAPRCIKPSALFCPTLPTHLPRAPTCSITTASSRMVDRMLLYRLLSPRSAARSAAAASASAAACAEPAALAPLLVLPPAAAAAWCCCWCWCAATNCSSRRFVNMGRVEM